MTIFEVEAIMRHANGKEDTFGGDTGSTEFYMVKHTLQEHLGEEHSWLLFYNHVSNDTFIIETKEAENKNLINQYIDIIKNIYKAYDRDRHLRFEIINVE
jgi:hypothetical protein